MQATSQFNTPFTGMGQASLDIRGFFEVRRMLSRGRSNASDLSIRSAEFRKLQRRRHGTAYLRCVAGELWPRGIQKPSKVAEEAPPHDRRRLCPKLSQSGHGAFHIPRKRRPPLYLREGSVGFGQDPIS